MKPNFGLPMYTHTAWCTATRFGTVTHPGDGKFWGSTSPPHKGQGSQAKFFFSQMRVHITCHRHQISVTCHCDRKAHRWQIFTSMHIHAIWCRTTKSGRIYGTRKFLQGRPQPTSNEVWPWFVQIFPPCICVLTSFDAELQNLAQAITETQGFLWRWLTPCKQNHCWKLY